jgi:hypothetical protein
MARWMILFLMACGSSVPRPEPPIAEPRVVAPRAPVLDVRGRWRFTHDGGDWVTMSFEGDLPNVTIDEWHEGSWTQFRVTRVKLDATSMRIEAQYLEFPNTVTIELVMEQGALVGTVNGDTYGTPSVVRGVRVPL